MNNSDIIDKMQDLTGQLIGEALYRIHSDRPHSALNKEPRFRTAEYLLAEAKEFVDSSCMLLKKGNLRASLSTVRWVLEAALNLLWITSDESQIDDRIRDFLAEAYRQEAAYLDDFMDLCPEKADFLSGQAQQARDKYEELQGKQLPSLASRMGSLKSSGFLRDVPNPYALYRECCAAAHPSVDVWRRYKYRRGATVTGPEKPDTRMPFWMIAMSTVHLVSGTYCLTGIEQARRELPKWWTERVVPLLNDLKRS